MMNTNLMRILFFNRAKTVIVLALLLAVSGLSKAQDTGKGKTQDDKEKKKEWTDGGIESVEIEIVKERQINLPKANRNFEKIPPRPFEPIKPPITYDFNAFNFKTAEINPQIRPLKLKETNTSSNFYGGYVSLGYGNYGTPYAEGFLNTRKDKSKLVGAHAWYTKSAKGPVDGKNSGGGTSGVGIYGKTFGNIVSFDGNVGFENRSTHFYGYPANEMVDRDTLQQAYNVFSLGGSLTNTKNTDFSYKLGANFSYLADKFSAKETEVNLIFNAGYKIDDETSIKLDANYFIINRKDELINPKARNIFQVKGGYYFTPMENLSVNAGVIVAYENDTLDSKDLHVYPDLAASYKVNPSIDFLVSLSGGIDKVSLHSLSNENIWLAPNIPIVNTNRTFEFLVGMNGRLGKKVEVHAGIALANLKNFYYYMNSPDDQSKFLPQFDRGGTKRSNLYAALSYAQSEKAKFMVRGDVFSYTPDEVAEAWHRPLYKLTANGSLNVYDKILLKADVIAQGGMKAFDQQTLSTVKLKGAFDLNLRAEYLFSESFSFFLQFNNITSNKYPVFYNYPVRGFQVLGGITWSF